MLKSVMGVAAVTAGLLAGASGVAWADDVIVYDGETGLPWSWPTQAACISDGPDMHLENVGDDNFYQYWYCQQHDDGLWYLHNSDQITHTE